MTETAILRRQQLEEERRPRIFDAKTRTIGVDKQALDGQVEEAARLRLLQKDRDEFFNAQATMMDQHAVFLARQDAMGRAANAADVQRYREQFQRTDAAREWDLNDPQAKFKDLPARIGDYDPRCGVASLQRFHGEDLGRIDRKRAQQQQVRAWTEASLGEKSYKKWLEDENDRIQIERMDELNKRGFDLDKTANAERRALARATAEFNLSMARQKERERADTRRHNTLQNMEEIRNALDSDLLTENPSATLNVTDPNRYKRSHMKGLMPEHRQAILNEQAAQREEMRRQKLKEAEDERQWELAAARTNAAYGHLEAVQRADRRRAVEQLQLERQQQAAEALARTQHLDNTYRNDIGDEYFDRWGTTTR